MAGRLLPGTTLRVRRGRRDDLVAVCAVLGVVPPAHLPRGLRRLLADLGADVYVAEEPDGTVVGVVAVTYARSLFRGGMAAVLDGARTRPPAGPETLAGLVAFAEDRARRRGCRRLTAWPGAADAVLRSTLAARGYRMRDAFVRDLGA
jgi:hypothetical protein